MNITKRIIGILKILLSLVWMGVAILLLIYGQKGLLWLNDQSTRLLNQGMDTITLADRMITETSDVMLAVDDSLSEVETSMIDGGVILLESRPLVDKTSQILVEDVPRAMEDVQNTMPAVIEATRTIEQTLALLSGFKFVLPNPFGEDFQFDLGVVYEPEVSLEQSLIDLSGSLQSIPEQMRTMEGDLVSADISLSVMSENVLNLAQSLDKVRETLTDIHLVLESVDSNLDHVQESFERIQDQLPGYLSIGRTVLITFCALLILTQFPAIYSGYQFYREEEIRQERRVEGES